MLLQIIHADKTLFQYIIQKCWLWIDFQVFEQL